MKANPIGSLCATFNLYKLELFSKSSIFDVCRIFIPNWVPLEIPKPAGLINIASRLSDVDTENP